MAPRYLSPHCHTIEISFGQQPVLLLRDEQPAGFSVGLLDPQGDAP